MILLLVGNAGCGKDSFARAIAKNVPNTEVLAFAEPIKEFGSQVMGFTHKQLFGPSELRNAPDERFTKDFRFELVNDLFLSGSDWRNKRRRAFAQWTNTYLPKREGVVQKWFKGLMNDPEPITPRRVLQTLGTEVGRRINQNVWANIGLRRASEKLANGADMVVITDGRFRNEIQLAKATGARVVKVIGLPMKQLAATHQSETELAAIPDFWYDALVYNNKSHGLESLNTTAYNLFNQLNSSRLRLSTLPVY